MTDQRRLNEAPRRVYRIEVCKVCGAQLSTPGISAPNGRCAVSRDHWKVGGVVLEVVSKDAAERRERSAYGRGCEGAPFDV